jgi:hypothetical protein
VLRFGVVVFLMYGLDPLGVILKTGVVVAGAAAADAPAW